MNIPYTACLQNINIMKNVLFWKERYLLWELELWWNCDFQPSQQRHPLSSYREVKKMVERADEKIWSSAFHGWMLAVSRKQLLDLAIMYNPLLDNNCFAYVQPSHWIIQCVYKQEFTANTMVSRPLVCFLWDWYMHTKLVSLFHSPLLH